MAISEARAWQLAGEFAQAVIAAVPADVMAVVVIGSLATGAYRPGRSDIDTLLVVRDQTADRTIRAIRQLRDDFRQTCAIPKGLGAVIIRERELWPPYDPEQELVPEILRLKQQGVVIRGGLDLASIPEPTAADIHGYIDVFYRWLHRHFVVQRPPEACTVDATVNTILYELRLLVWEATGDYVFDKSTVVARTKTVAGGHELDGLLTALETYLEGEDPETPMQYWENALQTVARAAYGRLPQLTPPNEEEETRADV